MNVQNPGSREEQMLIEINFLSQHRRNSVGYFMQILGIRARRSVNYIWILRRPNRTFD